MTASMVALSDLHLGYDRSVLRDPAAQDHLAEAVAESCGGSTDRLILCGDAFEACVPANPGDLDDRGYPRSAAGDARSFFDKLTSVVDVGRLDILWGNHDLAMGVRLARKMGVGDWQFSHMLNWGGRDEVSPTRDFLTSMVGAVVLSKIDSAWCHYPNIVVGDGWPYVVFHHGHLLDDLVLGQEVAAKYELLRPLTKTGRPDVCLSEVESISDLARTTGPFVEGLWSYDSGAREHLWALLRRGEEAQCCPSFPNASSETARPVGAESPGRGLGHNLEWYARLLQADSSTPAPIGGEGKPSYLVYGHDHGGGTTEVSGYDGRRWKCVNLGGWTNDAGRSPTPHCHLLTWERIAEGSSAGEPTMECVRF